jgi:diaminopropionate ammonia-lyase
MAPIDSRPFWVANTRDRGWACEPPSTAVREFHRSLAGYAPTPLVELPQLAAELEVGRVLAKDESNRLGLPAFKALGASWAVHRVLSSRSGGRPMTVVSGTDGNHGQAVARFTRMLGHRAHVYVPANIHPAAIRAIADEHAMVTVVEGSYDDAVAAAARAAEPPDAVLVQDTAWEGYQEVPRWIVDGYETLFAETDEQFAASGLGLPDLVAVPTGVGSLLQAALLHYRSRTAAPGPAVISVEPNGAACVAASLAAGRLTTVETSPTAMAGLNCGTPSSLAWPVIRRGLDAAVVVSEADDIRAAHDLAALGVLAGPCGAASLAAVRTALTGPGSSQRRHHLHLDNESTVLLLITEGNVSNPVLDLPETEG